MMETMIPPQVGMRLRAKKKRPSKIEKAQIKKISKKMREKERRGTATIHFTTLVLKSSTMILMIESLR